MSENMRGAFLMMATMAAFTLNDSFFKSTAAEVPLFQAIMLRGFMTVAMLAAIAACRGELLRTISTQDRWVIVWRTIAELGVAFCFLNALFHLPLGDITAILQFSPLAITLAAAIFLGEEVGPRRYFAIAIGLCGVLIIIRPAGLLVPDFAYYVNMVKIAGLYAAFKSFVTERTDIYEFYAIGAVGFIVLRDLSTRKLSREVPSLKVALITAIAITGMGMLGTAANGWQSMPLDVLPVLFVAALFLIVGYLTGVMVMRVGEVGFVQPFRYTALVWGILLGFLFFGEVPDGPMLFGSALVVGTGIYTFYRERKLQA